MNLKTEITKLHYTKDFLKTNKKFGLFFLYAGLRISSALYGIGSDLKNFMYDKNIIKPKKVNAFIVSVGNFTTGGVGKTPVVAEIAKYFVEQGERVAIVSRGYGGKLDNKNVNIISDGINLYHKADMAGDEPYWLAVNLNMCAIITCSNRYKACQHAIKELGVTKIILDDGFQHRKLHRDLDIVLVDSEKLFGNGQQLPCGPLREKIKGFNRVDKLLVVSKNTKHDKAEETIKFLSKKYLKSDSSKAFLCKTEPDYVYNIITGKHLEKGHEITALSAIGQPEQFYKFLEKDYIIKNKITFDDHHHYKLEDIENISGNIITTEKDAVKLALLGRDNIFALKLKTSFDVKNILS